MFAIIGLGNPGTKYSKTRHNIGYLALDEIIKNFEIPESKNKYGGQLWVDKINKKKVVAFKSYDFMNDSGNAVIAQFSNNTRIEKVEIGNTSQGNGSITLPASLTVYAGLTSVPNSEVIWAIGPRQEYSTAEIKQYRILSLNEEEDQFKFKD